MTKNRGIVTAAAAMLVLGLCASCAAVVWPTAYRTIPVNPGQPRILAAREQRFTGRVELLLRDGWHDAVAPRAVIDSTDPLGGYTPDWRTRR